MKKKLRRHALTGELKKAAEQFPEIEAVLKKARINPDGVMSVRILPALPKDFATHATEGLRSSRWIVTAKAGKRHILRELPGDNNMFDISGILEAVPKNHEIIYIVLIQAIGLGVSLEILCSPDADLHQRIVNALADRVMGYA